MFFMHTFFVNTSEKVSLGAYRDILFQELLVNNELIVPCDYVPLNGLRAYAEEIARTINQQADIAEDTTLVVYMEDQKSQYSSIENQRPQTVADETLLSLKAEAALVWRLCEMGKRPQELVFIFGEHAKRDQTLEYDEVFLQDVRKRMWERIQLPPCQVLLDAILGKKEMAKDDLLPILKHNGLHNKIITQDDTDCYEPILNNLAELVMYHLQNDNQEISLDVLYACLGHAVEEFIQTFLRDQLMDKYAVSVRYMYLPVQDRDVHETHRSICRLMHYVYHIAYNGNHPDFFDMTVPLQALQLQQTENGPLHACLVPEINYKKLCHYLYARMECCSNIQYTPAEPPEELTDRVRRKETLIKSQYSPPELTARDIFSEKGAAGKHHSLIPDYLVKRNMRLSDLRDAVDKTIADILIKNDTNQQKITQYLNRIMSEYDRIKDDALQQVAFTENPPSITGSSSQNAEQYIDELRNIEDDLDLLKKEREKEVLQPPPHLVSTEDVRKQVAAVKKQTDYYFSSLKKGLILVSFCIAFILLFMVPYLVIMHRLFSAPQGYVFFIATLLIVAGALGVGSLLFSRIYKHKIIRLVKNLVSDFSATQRNNQKCLEEFGKFLYKTIPGYYALHRYDHLLHQYKKMLRTYMEKITFHEDFRRQQIGRIKSLLDNLDIHLSPEEAYSPQGIVIIDPNGDLIANKNVYILSADEVRETIQK